MNTIDTTGTDKKTRIVRLRYCQNFSESEALVVLKKESKNEFCRIAESSFTRRIPPDQLKLRHLFDVQ